MRKTYKLILSCFMILISFVVLVFGVYAASSLSYTSTNIVAYELEDVFCDISGSVSGAFNNDGTNFSSTYSWSNISPNVVLDKNDPSWVIGNMYFNKDYPNQKISVIISIENKTGESIKITPNWNPNDTSMYKVEDEVNSNAKIQVEFDYSIQKTNNYILLAKKGEANSSVTCTLEMELISDFDSFSDIDFKWDFTITVE